MRHAAAIVALVCVGCSGSSPSAPSSTPTVISLSGTVRAFDGSGINGATVTILDGPNGGKVAQTASGGVYNLSGLVAGTANVSAARTDLGFLTATKGTAIAGATSLDFTLDAPVFVMNGTGDTVFNMPVYVSKVRVQGVFGGNCQNFIMRINGSGVVNEILGTCAVATAGPRFEGTYLVPNRVLNLPGQVVQTTNSTGVTWTVTDVR